MKLKLSLDKNSIQEFLLDHVEKFVFGVVVLCFFGLVYGAASRERFDKEPRQLEQQVQGARSYIEKTPPEKDGLEPPPDYERLVQDVRSKIKPDDYLAQEEVPGVDGQPQMVPKPWSPLVFEQREKRSAPLLFAVEQLRGAAGRGALSQTGSTGIRPGGAAAALTTGLSGRRWVVLTGVVPVGRQLAAYREAFSRSQYTGPADVPQYVYYRVERAEVPGLAAGAEPQWRALNIRQAFEQAKGWGGKTGDLIPQRFIHPVLTFPLAPRVDKNWGPEVAHEAITGPPFDAVWNNPNAYRGRKVTWDGVEASREGLRVVYAWGVQSGLAIPGDARYFAVDYANPDAGSVLTRGGTITGVVQGQVQVLVNRTDRTSGAVTQQSMLVPLIKPVEEAEGPSGKTAVPTPEPLGADLGVESGLGATPATPAAPSEGPAKTGDESLLFRFFDFDVQPGAKYRYRVRLMLSNPNKDVPERYLERELVERKRQLEAAAREAQAAGNAALARSLLMQWQYIETPWTEATAIVPVPRDSNILAGPVSPGPRATDEPSTFIMIVKWLETTGTEAYQDFSVRRGAMANFTGMEFPPRGSTRPGEEKTSRPATTGGPASATTAPPSGTLVDYLTDTLIVDMRGGRKLPGRDRNVTEPGEILVLEPDGAVRVLSEAEDESEFKQRKQGITPEETTTSPAATPATGPVGPGGPISLPPASSGRPAYERGLEFD